MSKRYALFSLVAVVGLAFGGAAQAAVVQSWHEYIQPHPVSSTDLANTGQPSLSSITLDSGSPEGDVADLVDGSDTTDYVGGAGNTPFQVTISFDTSVNTLGYNITSIDSFAGNVGHWGTKLQTYDVYYSTVNDATFQLLASVDIASDAEGVTTGGTYLHVNLADDTSGVLASGVDALRFNFSANNDPANAGGHYREIDVLGSATIPEPASLALLGAGGMLIGFRRRRTA